MIRLFADQLAEQFVQQCRAAGLPEPVREYRPWNERRFRFDVAWPEHRVAVEIEGGRWVGGRHVRPTGFARDIVKYTAAAIAGWVVLRVLPEHIEGGEALLLVEAALGRRSRDDVIAFWLEYGDV